MGEERLPAFGDVRRIASEYVALNWRRLGGGRPLDPAEVRRWRDLRRGLEHLLGDVTSSGRRGGGIRGSLRVPARLWIRYSAGAGPLVMEPCENFSEDGAFVASRKPLPPGTPLRLEIEGGPAMDPIKTLGVVVWSQERSQGGRSGMGIHFHGVGTAQRLALAGQLASALVSI